jgi:hypothetical protein
MNPAEFDPVTGAYVLRVHLSHEDARLLECAALTRRWSVEGFARQIVRERLEVERILAELPEEEEPLS